MEPKLGRAARFSRLGKSQLRLCFKIYQYYQNWIRLINNQELGAKQEQLHTSSAVGHEKEKEDSMAKKFTLHTC